MTFDNIIQDIAAISTLLFVSFFIREKVSFFRKYFIPVSLIAGILGLLLGPQVLGSVSPIYIHFSDSMLQWTNFLFCFIFATSFLGTTSGKFGRDVASTTFITGSIHMMQIVFGIGIAWVLSKTLSNLSYEMGLLPVSGFYGGHGSAGIMGASFEAEGWVEATGIAMTYATVGMFAAVLGGMAIINYGAKKGFTLRKMDSEALKSNMSGGILEEKERKPMAIAISDSSAIDPMAFQFMIVGTVIAISYLLRISIIKVFPFWTKVPLHTMCLLLGALIGQVVSKTKYNQYIDRKSMKRISGMALEYVVAASVATIKLSVLATYFVPIIITSLILCAVTAVLALYLSKKWYGENWFEVALGAYGQCTGSLATGLLLIKVLDPNGETLASESVSGSSTVGTCFQLPYTTMGPIFLMASPAIFMWGTTGLLVAFLIGGFVLFGTHRKGK